SCWVHHWCAVWSEGVEQIEGEVLINVDKAVISGIQRPCDYCKRMGATIRCRAEGCSRFYHFPCSAASGSFQSMKQLALLCPEHIDKAEEIAGEEARCAVCDSIGELSGLLYCTGCGQHYHDACLEISATPLQRSGWQCPECKVCQTCRQPGEDSKMLVCDACDKGYHTFCLLPAIDSVPPDSWKCKMGTELEVVETAEVKESITEEELRPEGAEGSTETKVRSEVSTEQQAPLATVSDVDEKQKEETTTIEAVVTEAIVEKSEDTQDPPVKDSPDSPVPDTIEEAQSDVAETNIERQESLQGQDNTPQTEMESICTEETTETNPPTSSCSQSSQITLPVLEEAEPVVMDLEEVGSKARQEEAIHRTPPPAPQTEMPPASDTDDIMVQSEDEEEEDEQGVEESLEESLLKDESPGEDDQSRKEMQEDMKPELVLDESSNISHGDESSSGFLGSPAEADSQMLSMELSLMPAGRTRSDSLLTETEDSLPFDPLKPDGDKVKRRGSPGRSRGRGSGFPGKRRPRGGGGGSSSSGGRGRGRSRLKAMASCIDAFLPRMSLALDAEKAFD
ncbi:histone-lysine N-methyltransferase 2D-like, partial [Sinocyclocheilus grahami]|uniref:histone-lysine N-methyltransferase 2D-like n=1 Tax=Sinocyclocheilus grahami TaxID=75366 RepID=UPI0007ACB7A9